MSQRNPKWNRDELVLALELYFRVNPLHTSEKHPEIVRLSELLNQLSEIQHPSSATFRNPNGVYMKLCNFLRFDPDYHGKGLERGGRTEETIWNEFFSRQDVLRMTAEAISAHASYPELAFPIPPLDVDVLEGRILMRYHIVRERKLEIVRRKKEQALELNGKLRCEVCEFCFEDHYGEAGIGFIECHHRTPLHKLRPNVPTRLQDLALVCANCHRILHRIDPVPSINELRSLLIPLEPKSVVSHADSEAAKLS